MKRLNSLASPTLLPRLSLILLSISFYLWLFASDWLPLRIQNIIGRNPYMDLESVINASKCYSSIGDSVYSSLDQCGYQYGSFLLRFINFFNLGSINMITLGTALFISVFSVVLMVAFFSVRTNRQAILAFVFVSSPGSWLLFERGNFDLLIFLMVSLALIFMHTRFSFVTVLLISMTALMKFYTLPLLLLYVIVEKNRYLRIGASVALSLISFLVLVDIFKAPGFPIPTFVAFGLLAPGLWVNFFAWRFDIPFAFGTPYLYLIGISVFVAVALFISSLKPRLTVSVRSFSSPHGSALSRNAFLVFSGLYVSCFLAGMNYDYRLIFLVVALLLANFSFPSKAYSSFFLVAQIGALWSTVFFFGVTGPLHILFAIFGNLCQLVIAVHLLDAMYHIVTESIVSKRLFLFDSRSFRKVK
jgi:hypothetical protein